MAAQPLKCLFVSPVVPYPPDTGGRVRTYRLLRALQGQAEVHLRAIHESPQAAAGIAELARHCASAKSFERANAGLLKRISAPKLERWFHSPALARALASELAAERYDVVHLDEMFLVRSLERAISIPVVVHHHKLDTDFYSKLPGSSRAERAFDAIKLRGLEVEAARRFRHHVLTNPDEARELARRYPSIEAVVVENGFDPDALFPPATQRARDRLLFLGSLDYAPNIDGLEWFVRQVLPKILQQRADVRLEIVGSSPSDGVRALASEHVKLVGRVDDVREHLQRASALVVPLRIGGGTRLKIVEALGCATPVVSTRIGAEGLAFEDPAHLWLADDASDFAARALEVLADSRSAEARARRGRELALVRYTWNVLAAKLLEAWRHAASEVSE